MQTYISNLKASARTKVTPYEVRNLRWVGIILAVVGALAILLPQIASLGAELLVAWIMTFWGGARALVFLVDPPHIGMALWFGGVWPAVPHGRGIRSFPGRGNRHSDRADDAIFAVGRDPVDPVRIAQQRACVELGMAGV